MSARVKSRKVVPLRSDTKEEALETLREMFDLPTLASVIQRGSSDSTYELKLSDGKIIVLGSATEVHQQSKVRARLFDVDVILPPYSREKWGEVLRAIRDAVERVETFTEAEELKSYVVGYKNKHKPYDLARVESEEDEMLTDKLHRKAAKDLGFLDSRNGTICLSLNKFTAYLNCERNGRWSERDVANMLSRHGFIHRQKSVRYRDEKGESKTFNFGRFWISPDDYLTDENSEDSPV